MISSRLAIVPNMIFPSLNSAAWVMPGSAMEMALVFLAKSLKTGGSHHDRLLRYNGLRSRELIER